MSSADSSPDAYEKACLKEAKKVLAGFDRSLRDADRVVKAIYLEGSCPQTRLIVLVDHRRRGELRLEWRLWDPWLWDPEADGPTVSVADYVATLVLGDVFDS